MERGENRLMMDGSVTRANMMVDDRKIRCLHREMKFHASMADDRATMEGQM